MPKLTTRIALMVLSLALVRCSGGSSSSPPPTYAVGGQVSGLAGEGLVLHSSLGEDLPIAANGPFAFPTKAIGGTAYMVAVAVQPSSPAQTCTVSSGSGTIATGDVTTVSVSCTTNSYTVGGTVTGLAGSGLVLRNGAGPGADTQSITADGPFTFAAAVLSGASFSVSVDAQPSSPTQTCTVSGASGIVGGGNVTSVVVNCATDSFTIGGSITGLVGSGLVLENGGQQATINVANGTFAFATPVASGQSYAVSATAQPTSPWQTCTVGSGSGTVDDGNVSTVAVTCTTNSYTVGGSVSGLAGSGLVLRTGGQTVSVSGSSFTFPSPVSSGGIYAVSVETHPASPSQTCAVASGGSGTIAGAAVSDVQVSCTTNSYLVSGSISGLVGAGLQLRLEDTTTTGAETLDVLADGSFEFVSSIASGNDFAVTVQAQPSEPSQTCVVSGGTGTVGGGDVTSVVVNCSTDTYAIGGTIEGLTGSGLVLENNGVEEAAINVSAGTFAFPTPVASGQDFDVTVKTQPTSPWQTCSVASGSGTVTSAPVETVLVTCATNSYALGGSVAGLAGSGLVLRNGTQTLPVLEDGPFQFSTPVTSGASYAVVVDTQPSNPSQTCTVDPLTSGGAMQGTDVTDVTVSCATNAYFVGGSVSGLLGTMTLRNSGGDDLTISNDGPFSFATKVASGGGYDVTVHAQPTGQTCVVSAGNGAVGSGDVATVVVNCSVNTYVVGGSVTGLLGGGLTLANGSETVVVTGTAFAFPTPIEHGSSYGVSVTAQPTNPWQTCEVADGFGIATGDVAVSVTCTTDTYHVAANVTGLAGTGLTLESGSDQLTFTAAGQQTFATPIASGAPYVVTIVAQPTNPWQTCAFGASGNTGSIAGVDAVVDVTCTTNTYSVGGIVSGLLHAGTGVGAFTLRNNGTDDLKPTSNGPFTFATNLASNAGYSVTVATQPPTETCSVSNGAGTVTSADVTDVAVTCACADKRGDCNGQANDGCEVNHNTDDANCGACGVVCVLPNTCKGGTCK